MGQDVTFDIIARDRASSAFSNVGRSAKASSSSLQHFGAVAKKVFAAAAIYEGAKLATKGLVALGKAAADDQKSTALMAKQFRNSAKATRVQIAATEAWITKVGKAKGIADDELRPALGNLVTATHNVGKAQRLTGLAMDIAAAKQKPLATVSLALSKAYNGNVGALGRLGIKTKDAKGKTLEFSAAQKMLSQQFGGSSAAQAKTFSGTIDRLTVTLHETEEAIGYKLLPVATKFGNWLLNKGVPNTEKFISGMRNGTGAGGRLADRIKAVVDAARPLGAIVGGSFKNLAKYAKGAADAFNSLPSGVQKAVVTGAGLGLIAKKTGALNIGKKALVGDVVSKAGPVPVFVTNLGPGGIGGVAGKAGSTLGNAAEGAGGAGLLATIRGALTGKGFGNTVKAGSRIGGLGSLAVSGMIVGDAGNEVIDRGLTKKNVAAKLQAMQEAKYAALSVAQRKAATKATEDQATSQRSLNKLLEGAGAYSESYLKKLHSLPAAVQTKVQTPGAVESLTQVRNLKRQYDLTPKQVKTLIGLTGAQESLTAVQRLRAQLDGLHNKTVTVTMAINGASHANAVHSQIGQRATGGPVTAGQPYIVGERRAELFVPNQSGRIEPRVAGARGGGKHISLSPAGSAIVESLVSGMKSKFPSVKAVLGKLTNLVTAQADKLANLKDIKAGFESTFSADSVFGADATTGLNGLLRFQVTQAQTATQLMNDIQTVTSKGLSKALVSQLQASGSSGAAQLHLLAGASASQIAQFNSLDAQTSSADQAAGLLAGNYVRGGNITNDIATAQQTLAFEQALVRALSKSSLKGEVKVRGGDLIVAIRATNHDRGRSPGDFSR